MTGTHPDTTSTPPARELIARWDTCAIAQERAFILRQDDPALSDEEAFCQACLDTDIMQMEWDWLLEDLTSVLAELSPEGWFHAEGRNMGWRRLSGHKTFRAADWQAFLDELLPKTECGFTIEREGSTLHVVNFHHDAPMGELYAVTAVAEPPP